MGRSDLVSKLPNSFTGDFTCPSYDSLATSGIHQETGMTIDKKTIEAMKDAGVSFVGTIATPGGGRTIGIAPDEVAEFVADKIGFSA